MQNADARAKIAGMGRTDTQRGGMTNSRAGLLTHDVAVVRAMLRALGGNRSDLLTLLIGIPLLVLIARDWATHLPAEQQRWLAVGVGLAIGFTASAQAIARIAYHRSDGIMAVPAQHRRARARLAMAINGTALVMGIVGLLVLDAFLALSYVIGFSAGAVGAAAAGPLRRSLATARAVLGRHLPNRGRQGPARSWPIAVVGAMVGGALMMLPVAPPVGAIVAALVAFTLGTALGPVDAEVVAYLTIIGRTSRAIVIDRIARPLAFLIPFAGAVAVGRHPIALIAVVSAAGAVPLLIALRVLAYRLFGKRGGDWFIGLLLAVAALALVLFPPLAPAVLLVGLVRLERSAAPKRWLIA